MVPTMAACSSLGSVSSAGGGSPGLGAENMTRNQRVVGVTSKGCKRSQDMNHLGLLVSCVKGSEFVYQ